MTNKSVTIAVHLEFKNCGAGRHRKGNLVIVAHVITHRIRRVGRNAQGGVLGNVQLDIGAALSDLGRSDLHSGSAIFQYSNQYGGALIAETQVTQAQETIVYTITSAEKGASPADQHAVFWLPSKQAWAYIVCDQFPDAKILEMPTLTARESILAEFGPEMVICPGAEFEPLLRRGSFASAIRRLAARQRELLPLVIKGLSNREIAQIAGVSERLVRSEVSELLDTFEASNRTELAMVARAGA